MLPMLLGKTGPEKESSDLNAMHEMSWNVVLCIYSAPDGGETGFKRLIYRWNRKDRFKPGI